MRRLRIRRAAAPARDVELRRPEDLVLRVDLLDDLARELLGRAVRGRGVEHPAAELEHLREHAAHGVGVVLPRGLAERRRAAEADDRQPLAGRGDRARDQRAVLVGREESQRQHRERARGRGERKTVTPSRHLLAPSPTRFARALDARNFPMSNQVSGRRADAERDPAHAPDRRAARPC